ncbi:MAG: CvpA family protein [Clostridia bacterium]|nr:CvpA family protein [Clostridia bacterium]
MDPIKVDFTKKGKAGVRKPAHTGIKQVICILGALVGAAISYYFYLPPINLKSFELYIWLGMIIGIYLVLTVITSGMIMSPDYTPYAKKKAIPPVIIAGIIALVVGVCYLPSCVFFRAESYSKIISVDESKTFTGDIEEVNFKSVPILDKEAAEALAKRTLGDLSDQVSQFEVGTDFTQINYKENPFKVTTLAYGDIFKWLKNTSSGFPGYIRVNMVTQKADFVRTDEAGLGFGNIRYSTYEHFQKYLKRHVRFEYPTYLLGKATFEIDEKGYPYWFVPVEDKTVGVFGGTDVKGVLIVDAITGEITEYTVDDVKSNKELQWIDGIFSADLLVQQYNYHGKYSGGFWNYYITQTGVKVATEGSNYLAIDDDVYMYTGVTSAGQDQAIIGFVMVNMRTKEANYYAVSGAKEYSAMTSANGALQNYEYQATFPILLNISGQPTYFMSMLDDSKLVKMYAMVNVTSYQVVATGESIAECMTRYVSQLKANNIIIDVDVEQIEKDENAAQNDDTDLKVIKGTVTDIRTAVIDGDSVYYIKLDSSKAYFSVKAAEAEKVVILNTGNKVSMKADTDEGDIIAVKSFEIVK